MNRMPYMNYRFLCTVLASFVFVFALGYVVINYDMRSSSTASEVVSENVETVNTPPTQQVELFYYRPLSDMSDAGELQCSKDGLVAVSYSIEVSDITIENTIKALLARDLRQIDRHDGLISHFPLDGLVLIGVHVDDGLATIALDDRKDAISSDTCQSAVLQAQITATLKQFSSINEVCFIPENFFGA